MTKQSRDARISEFLTETLALWAVDGVVETSDEHLVVRVADRVISIERTNDGPFRWVVRAGENPRPRGCASLLGVLRALRRALDVDRGAPLRVVPAPVAT